MSPSDHVIIHTDGACKGNPGPGGWGALLQTGGGHEKELWGGEANTTNNRMELMAAIMALEALKRPCKVELHTDSKYVMQGITEWMRGWKARGWLTADKKPVKNADLWQRLDAARLRHDVKWRWVKGHAGHELNERADQLANRGVADLKRRKTASTSFSGSAGRRRTRDPLMTAPNRAVTAAIWKPCATPLIGAVDSRKATTTAPSDWPTTRAIPNVPPAAPARSFGASDSMARLLGDWKKPNPAPQTAIRQTTSKCVESAFRKLSAIRPQAKTLRPIAPRTPAEYRSDR